MRSLYTTIILIFFLQFESRSQTFTLTSPDQHTQVKVRLGEDITYSLSYRGQEYVQPSAIAVALSRGTVLGKKPQLRASKTTSVNQILRPLYGISKELKENYRQLKLDFKGNYSVVFRAYNEGFAYRFETNLGDSMTVKSELNEFRFAANYPVYFHPDLSESNYRLQKIADVLNPNYSSLPVLVKAPGANILIHESDVLDYPCLSVIAAGKSQNTLLGQHASYPKKTEMGGYANYGMIVKETQDYIARTKGKRTLPWRLLALSKEDKDILNNQLVYLLASENRLKDASWVKPGKVAWDWWNALNLTGVPFKAGINTETYKYFIDFAAANHLEYVNLDEGWSDPFDLLKISNEVDMKELVRYAKEKNVGLVLWCVWHTLDRQMIAALDQFQNWGISGVKVDFMNRDDQMMVRFHERLLQEAAKRKLLVNFHGAYHPTGTARTYPNQINVEGVKGLEWNKFDPAGTSPDHDVMLPYVRMFAGSMDYTPGAMQNYNKKDWRQIADRPQSQGTRCHQLAMYVVYYAPLQMLADAPTAYQREPEYLKFLSHVPTVWDETVPLAGEAGQYVAVARKKADEWYLGAMTGWAPRKLSVPLDFLPAGVEFNAEIFRDGPNAERVGSDLVHEFKKVKKGDTLSLQLEAGGGWAASFKPVSKTN